MKKSNPNPFLYGRREYENQKGFDIFVPKTKTDFDFFHWISGQQFLFEGIRGSGKTSILKSMHWSLAWKNNYVEKIKGGKEIEDYFYGKKLPKHLGVIFKCDSLDNEVWNEWAEIHGTNYAQRIFAVYLEYSFLYLLLDALSSIILENREILKKDWSKEEVITKEILAFVFPDKSIRPLLQNYTFYDLSILFRDKSGIIRSQICQEVPYTSIISNLNLNDAGKTIQFLGEKVIEIPALNEVLIFPMIDDCDRLKPWQTMVVATFIFRARYPISYKLTSVINLDNLTYTTDKRPLTEHELKKLSISGTVETDWEINSSYYNHFNGILQTRINNIYGNEFSNSFDLKKLLGQPSIDDLIINVIKESRAKDAIKFYDSFLAQKRDKSIVNYFMRLKGIIDEPLDDSVTMSAAENKMRKRKYYTFFNKRRQVAAIAMFKTKELKNIKYPYAGLNVILKLCCGSIRELLRIMYEIWEEAKLPIDEFIKQENLSFEIQNRSIRKASDSYWESIVINKAILNTDWDKKMTFAPPTSPLLICNRLGQLLSQLQSYPYICKSNEIGSLRILISSQDVEHIIDYLTMGGVILQNKQDGQNVEIALHPFFAPRFGLSPRHPFYYYKVLTEEEFEIMIRGSDYNFNKRILNNDLGQMTFDLED